MAGLSGPAAGVAAQDVTTLRAIEALAGEVLSAAGVLRGGWRLAGVSRLDDDTITVRVRDGDAAPVVLEWIEHRGVEGPAFHRGARFSSGYRNAPGAVSVDDAPEALRQWVDSACRALAHAEVTLPAGDRTGAARTTEAPRSAPSTLAAVRAAASRALAPLLPEGWAVRRLRRLDARSVAIEVTPGEGPGLALEWLEPGDARVRACAVGARFAAGYRQDAGAWDPDDAETPAQVRDLALAACRRLAEAEADDVSLVDQGGQEARSVRLEPAEVTRFLAHRFAVGDRVAGRQFRGIERTGDGTLAFVFEGVRVMAALRDDAPVRSGQLGLWPAGPLAEALAEHLRALEVDHRFVTPERLNAHEQAARVPMSINLALTTFCNALCRFCMVTDILNRPELNLSDEQLQHALSTARDEGCTHVDYTGGEPSVHQRVVEIIEFARGIGYTHQSISTNGIKFKREPFCRRVIEAGLTCVDLSVHGHTDALHDELVSHPGALEAIRRACGHLTTIQQERAFELSSTTVITTRNYRHLREIAAMLDDLGVGNKRFKHAFEGQLTLELIGEQVPRYEDIVPHVVAAVDELAQRDSRIEVTHIPLCLLGDHAVFSRDFEFAQVDMFIWHIEGGLARDQHAAYHHRATAKACERCVLRRRCTRLDAAYAEHHGEPELLPFESTADVEALFDRAEARFPGSERLVADTRAAFQEGVACGDCS